jgi:antagonist of KipI
LDWPEYKPESIRWNLQVGGKSLGVLPFRCLIYSPQSRHYSHRVIAWSSSLFRKISLSIMAIRILKTGLLDTIQDLGRTGYARWGINPSGVMDTYASRVANALVGNSLEEAVLEMHFPACELAFENDALVSITGGDFEAELNGERIASWKPIVIRKGAHLRFTRRKSGSRCYVAVNGGFDLTPWLESKSTNLKAHAGGYSGRALRKGDVIQFLDSNNFQIHSTIPDNSILPWSVNYSSIYTTKFISFIEGPEWNWLSEKSKQYIVERAHTLESRSDRMGFYLLPGKLSLINNMELLSSAVTFGTMQILPSGQTVILMADHQTTGGYPRIGHVVTAHHPVLAQLSPGEMFTFKKVSIETAEQMLNAMEKEIGLLKEACLKKLEAYYAEH